MVEASDGSILKIGIFIVSYNASSTIQELLRRIPDRSWDRIHQIFVFDDSSKDATVDIVTNFKEVPQSNKLHVFFNEVNLGYGGNQKRGYLYAMSEGIDAVILLHGDAQYAPEEIPNFIEALSTGECDAVFGSRMLSQGGARRGGMPLYKYLGNKVLTSFQNWALGQQFTEYHSGYRAYRMDALSRVPFLKNTNDFHFDNEIILQLLAGRFKIREIPIPTYYGSEICYVNGMQYAFNVFLTTLKFILHRRGFSYFDQFDLRSDDKYTFKNNYFSSHHTILRLIQGTEGPIKQSTLPIEHPGEPAEENNKPKVLYVGSGSGFLAAKISDLGYEVVGVDQYHSEEAIQSCKKFIVCKIQDSIELPEDQRFDCIVFADVLERVRSPEDLLLWARGRLKPGGRIVASTGNVAHFYVRLMLILGRFTYTERGILDRTHRRLFTLRSFRKAFADCGYALIRETSCPIPFENLIPGRPGLTDFMSWLNMLACHVWASLFAYQIVIEVRADQASVSEYLRRYQIGAPYIRVKSMNQEGRINETVRGNPSDPQPGGGCEHQSEGSQL